MLLFRLFTTPSVRDPIDTTTLSSSPWPARCTHWRSTGWRCAPPNAASATASPRPTAQRTTATTITIDSYHTVIVFSLCLINCWKVRRYQPRAFTTSLQTTFVFLSSRSSAPLSCATLKGYPLNPLRTEDNVMKRLKAPSNLSSPPSGKVVAGQICLAGHTERQRNDALQGEDGQGPVQHFQGRHRGGGRDSH